MARNIVYHMSEAYNLGYDDGYKDGCEEYQVVDADGKPVTVETLKNACEIVRNTTKQKVIDKACEWIFNNYADVYNEEINDCKYGEGWRKDFIKAMEYESKDKE